MIVRSLQQATFVAIRFAAKLSATMALPVKRLIYKEHGDAINVGMTAEGINLQISAFYSRESSNIKK